MARPSSRPGAQEVGRSRKAEQPEDATRDNDDDHATETSTCFDDERQDHPAACARTCKTVDALLHTDAFVMDGEWFYDAVAVEGEDAFAAMDERAAYWGLQVDSETRMVYYFNHSRPAEMQWLPPADLTVHPDTHEVLLWDASAQWFYYYNPQVSKHVASYGWRWCYLQL
ncbi:hypothetical protein PHYPSEUDO_005402 [Phytophthora pseudosyringae]|uniref:Uncharacterized protein n=1 Tax=Phytophthora pseudosyringae TaxID=221518 RepID=A0A8T1VP44_9STRA|nr:hypothetical protein PHYPSEUDO_005402 [Phytophthora pseudosyringae]